MGWWETQGERCSDQDAHEPGLSCTSGGCGPAAISIPAIGADGIARALAETGGRRSGRQAIGHGDPRHAIYEAGPAQRDVQEEPQRRSGQVHPGSTGAERGQVKLIASQIVRLGGPATGRGSHERSALPDIVARMLAEPADGHVLDHPLDGVLVGP